MTLARSHPDSPAEWWILIGVLALYVLARLFFAWWRARAEGDRHPVRAAFSDEDESDTARTASVLGGFASYRQLFGFAGSALLVGLVAGFTDGTPRVVLLSSIVPVLVVGLAYLDFRLALRGRRQPQPDRRSPSLD
ncbi:hypothetical protein [Streptomyces sp. CRN 30]|uniref:hypothetical protein n=1 Tax=Streptomyces sp. CRN 30 TaxID=3075613 RepID=UPI002A82980B|nr:hypothetical protein [Streptomyces sp. CRN 30]